MNKDSQRGSVLEIVEIIANLCALQSHCTELYQDKVTDLAGPDLFTEDELAKIQEEAAALWKERADILDRRRQAMRMLKSLAVNYKAEVRCKLKHRISVYQFSQELVDTDTDDWEYIEFAEWAYVEMIKTLSEFLWIEIVTCWRCLSDELALNKNKNENDVWNDSGEIQD